MSFRTSLLPTSGRNRRKSFAASSADASVSSMPIAMISTLAPIVASDISPSCCVQTTQARFHKVITTRLPPK